MPALPCLSHLCIVGYAASGLTLGTQLQDCPLSLGLTQHDSRPLTFWPPPSFLASCPSLSSCSSLGLGLENFFSVFHVLWVMWLSFLPALMWALMLVPRSLLQIPLLGYLSGSLYCWHPTRGCLCAASSVYLPRLLLMSLVWLLQCLDFPSGLGDRPNTVIPRESVGFKNYGKLLQTLHTPLTHECGSR